MAQNSSRRLGTRSTVVPQIEPSHTGLSIREERILLAAFRRGMMAEASILSGKASRETLAQAARGREAQDKLVLSHLPLARALAWEAYRKSQPAVQFDDLVSAACVGLLVALQHFDSDVGVRFNTYARHWIANKISLQIRTDRWQMKIPERIYKQVLNLMKTIRTLTGQTGHAPNVDELAEAMNLPTERVQTLLAWTNLREVSLATPIGDDGGSVLEDIIGESQNPWHVAMPEYIASGELRAAVHTALSTFTPREAKIIKMHYGLGDNNNDYDGSSLRKVADKVCLSGERVRQIEASVIRRLRGMKNTFRYDLLFRCGGHYED
jgi:RNA polymerase primary sigma factor